MYMLLYIAHIHIIPYSGYFSEGKFSWFSWLRGEPQHFFTHETVPQCTRVWFVYCDHEKFSTNWPKIHSSQKIYPPKNTRYTVHMQYCLTDIEEKNFLYYSKFLTFFPQIVPDLIDKQSIILGGGGRVWDMGNLKSVK